MKHIFIMNPAAGKGKAARVFLPKIIEAAKRLGIDYEIHRTIAPDDARHFVKKKCEETAVGPDPEAALRFYACGGDGTLNEVINGAYGYINAETAMIPAGTGNDFPRNFGDLKYFEDIERQILGAARPIDVIRYETISANPAYGSVSLSYKLDSIFESDPDPVVRYGVNMFNIGFDCNVVAKTAEIKSHPFVPGLLAYGLGVAIILVKKEGVDLEICFDDNEVHRGGILLAAIGNGSYCGGGFKGVPKASVDDGLMDVSIVENVSRRTFLALLSKYRNGTHLEDPAAEKIITYRKCKKLTILADDAVKLCADGEITTVGEANFEIVPGGIKFSVPQGCE
ncbi:MAG TPA: diacylglycerol kinase family protein [Syntrophomonas sp.]|nr:diacylglycerol kinase family protein [Syntrophomonas sp.]